MATTLTLPEGYGPVAAIALGVIPFVSFWHGISAARLRKASGVMYPNYYATQEQTKTSKAAYRYQCAQRAHGNYLENMPQTLISMLVAGIEYPRATAVTGAIWVVSRLIYQYGYIWSDEPEGKGRRGGMGFFFAQGALWGMSLAVFGKSLLEW
ncbi:hypothetical protein FQN54_000821 [Arachnomyces sp. PD_36]|nr:hypothetical protein FQN54_000821 [Arachnomyces sp. PD_36]